jgi:excisionase family DNA binding protein
MRNTNSDYLTVSAAANALGISSQTIRGWERRGFLRALKTENGTRIFLRSEVERMAQRLREDRGSPEAGHE